MALNRPSKTFKLKWAALSVLLCLLAGEASAQAGFGFWACVLYCPRTGARFAAPVGGPCRLDTNCALAFADFVGNYLGPCGATSFQDFAQSAQFQAIPVTDASYCQQYNNLLRSTQTTFQGQTSSAVAQQSADASCSCNTVVTELLSVIRDEFIPQSSSGASTAICTYLTNKIVTRFSNKALGICKKAVPGTIADGICDFVMGLVNSILTPVTSLVTRFCSTVLQTLLDVLGFANTINQLLTAVRSGSDSAINSASNLFCGVTVCTSRSQATCSQSQNKLQAVISTGISKLCEALSGGEDPPCFPSTATMRLCSGQQKTLAELANTTSLGRDVVRAADGTCSPIIFFSTITPHAHGLVLRIDLEEADNSCQGSSLVHLPAQGTGAANTTLVIISNQTSFQEDWSFPAAKTARLMLTANNYVPLADGRLVVAHTIQPGQLLLSANGSKMRVTGTSLEYHRGLYHPHLQSLKDYAVNDILVSQYTQSIHPDIAKPALYTLRALHSLGLPVQLFLGHSMHTLFSKTVRAVPGLQALLASPDTLPATYYDMAALPGSVQSEQCVANEGSGVGSRSLVCDAGSLILAVGGVHVAPSA